MLITICLILMSFTMKKHVLSVLLTLELLLLFLIYLSIIMGVELFFGLLIICVGACEGAVGLGSIISVTRTRSYGKY